MSAQALEAAAHLLHKDAEVVVGIELCQQRAVLHARLAFGDLVLVGLVDGDTKGKSAVRILRQRVKSPSPNIPPTLSS